MYQVSYSSQFKKDLKKYKRMPKVIERLKFVIAELQEGKPLSASYVDHKLQGYKNRRECHIYPDVLLVYTKEEDELLLLFLRMGSHSDLF